MVFAGCLWRNLPPLMTAQEVDCDGGEEDDSVRRCSGKAEDAIEVCWMWCDNYSDFAEV